VVHWECNMPLENLTNDAFANKMADYYHTHLGAAEFKSIREEATSGNNPKTPLWLPQPYIQRGIQKGSGIPNLGINLLTAPVIDTARVTKFMGSPKGLLFIAKQVGLQMSNPKGEFLTPGPINAGRIYNPAATIAQILTGPLGVHMDRHALGPLNPEALNYEKRIKAKTFLGQNRLVSVANQLNVGHFRKLTLAPSETDDITSEKPFIKKIADRIKNTNWYINRSKKINALSGWGGPNSLFGIGWTTHRTSKPQRIDGEVIAKYQPPTGTDLPIGDSGPDSYTAKLPEGMYVNAHNFFNPINPNDPKLKADSSQTKYENPLAKYKTLEYGDIVKEPKARVSDGTRRSFRDGTRYAATDVAYSRIGLIDYGKGDKADDEYGDAGSDYITLKIQRGDSSVRFRSYGLGSITDNTTFNWTEVKYSGRTMAQQKFDSIARDISHDIMIVAFTAGELKTNYNKLNTLYQLASPEIDATTGLPSAAHCQLTLGDLYVGQNVIIDKITFTVDESTSWDIAYGAEDTETAKAELPMVIKLNMGYKLLTNRNGGFFSNTTNYWKTFE
jgi:hypothetical protein